MKLIRFIKNLFFRKRRKEASLKEQGFDEVEKAIEPVVASKDNISRRKLEYQKTRQEYQILTEYLNDMEKIENLPDEDHDKIVEIASQIALLTKAKKETIEKPKRLSDSQNAFFLQMEDLIPDVIDLMKENEADQTIIKRDLDMLEGEKVNWSFELSLLKKEKQKIRNIGIIMFTLLAGGLLIMAILKFGFMINVDIPYYCLVIAGLITAIVLFVKHQNLIYDIRMAESCLNKSILLQNKVKLKLIPVSSAVDYQHEKYHVVNSTEFLGQWEAFLEMKKEQEKMWQTDEDLAYYHGLLMRKLHPYQLYDIRVWGTQTAALSDHREMVELRHEMLQRRQKLRERMEAQLQEIKEIDEMI